MDWKLGLVIKTRICRDGNPLSGYRPDFEPNTTYFLLTSVCTIAIRILLLNKLISLKSLALKFLEIFLDAYMDQVMEKSAFSYAGYRVISGQNGSGYG